MTQRTYLAAICGEPGNYGIVFRDVPGCTSAATNFDEATAMATEALTAHIALSLEYGDAVPEPTEHTLAEVRAEFDDPADPIDEAWVALIPVTIDIPAAPQNVRIDIPRVLYEEVLSRDTNTGRFILEATRGELARRKKSA